MSEQEELKLFYYFAVQTNNRLKSSPKGKSDQAIDSFTNYISIADLEIYGIQGALFKWIYLVLNPLTCRKKCNPSTLNKYLKRLNEVFKTATKDSNNELEYTDVFTPPP